MKELQIFKNDMFGEIRTIETDGKILFCGADVAKALGYKKPNNAVNQHCKNATLKQGIIDKMGRNQQISFIPEGDLYRLIVNSKLETAQKFEKWVFEDVLPTIRKHGMYATDELLNNPDFAIEIFRNLKEEREKRKALETENARQKQLIGELQPKVSYYDIILNNKGLVTVTQIAKDYGMSGNAMNALLHKLGIQYKQSGQWLLYSDYHDKGYTHSKTIDIKHKDGTPDTKMQTKWTQKGRLFIYQLLKENDIIPMIEKDIAG